MAILGSLLITAILNGRGGKVSIDMISEDLSSKSLIEQSKKIVFKFGSHALSNPSGGLNLEFFDDVTQSIKKLIDQNKQIVIVSSGAGISGAYKLKKMNLRDDITYKQALCSIGQVELMKHWGRSFEKEDINIGQLLFTNEDFQDPRRKLNMHNTLFTLLDEEVIPIINENDSVSFDEITVGDNDNLSAETAKLWQADLLIMLSEVDGIYNKNPKESDAEIFPIIDNLNKTKEKIKVGSKSAFGTGGVATKIESAEKVLSYGGKVIVTKGRVGIINDLINNNTNATLIVG